MTLPAATTYRAFLSYAHGDGRQAARLHRRLEAFRVKRDTGAEPATSGRRSGDRLRPVFRDRDELASSGSLTLSIQQALDASAALIVLCSPAAVASRWVNEEIRYFRARHAERPVFAFVVAGEPGADPRHEPTRAAFPVNLLLSDIGRPEGPYADPLAADARRRGDGFNNAFLKLVAGLLGVPYDRLRQRETRRRQQRMALVAGAAIGLSVVFAALAWRATMARNEARAARAQAELELLSERQTRAFLLSVFELADPGEARGQTITVREVLDRAVERIDSTEFSRPGVRSRFLATMGQAYSRLGLNRRGAELLRQSLAVLDAHPDAPDARSQVTDSRLELADVLFDMGDYAAAIDALAPFERPEADLGLSDVQRARAANIRGDVLAYTDRESEAAALYQRTLGLLPGIRLSPEESAGIESRALGGLAALRHFEGDHAQAQELFARVVALLLPVYGETHPYTISALISLGSAAYAGGDRVAARDSWLRAMAAARGVLDEDNPEVGTLKNNLGRLLLEEGDYAEAEPLLLDALASDRRHRVEGFEDLAFSLHNLALTRLAHGDPLEAESLLREAQDVAEASGHRMLGPILVARADIACADGRSAEGLAWLQRASETIAEAYGPTDWRYDQATLITAFCLSRGQHTPPPDAYLPAYCRLASRWGTKGFFAGQARQRMAALGPVPSDSDCG